MQEKKRVAIVIPVYREMPTELEKVHFQRLAKLYKNRYPIFLFVPENLKLDAYQRLLPSLSVLRMSARHFQGLESYNELMLSPAFYEIWLQRGYSHILLWQPDVFLLGDQLEAFLRMPYDYIGGPLFKVVDSKPFLYGGNGGLSLRSCHACATVLQSHRRELIAWHENEDEVFSLLAMKYPEEFSAAPLDIAMQFAFDRFGRVLWERNGMRLPMGLHGWFRYDPAFYRKLIQQADPEAFLPALPDLRAECEKAFRDFLDGYDNLYLYGAGDWGKVFYHALTGSGYSVKGFIVSDGEQIPESCCGKPVYPLQQVPVRESLGVVTAISWRYRAEQVFSSIVSNLHKKGIYAVFRTDMVLYNAAIEQWLREGEKR